MEKTLERILSLIPRKENGSYVHGGKAAFAKSIGYDSEEVVAKAKKASRAIYIEGVDSSGRKFYFGFGK